jgi:hypothetical protein
MMVAPGQPFFITKVRVPYTYSSSAQIPSPSGQFGVFRFLTDISYVNQLKNMFSQVKVLKARYSIVALAGTRTAQAAQNPITTAISHSPVTLNAPNLTLAYPASVYEQYSYHQTVPLSTVPHKVSWYMNKSNPDENKFYPIQQIVQANGENIVGGLIWRTDLSNAAGAYAVTIVQEVTVLLTGRVAVAGSGGVTFEEQLKNLEFLNRVEMLSQE